MRYAIGIGYTLLIAGCINKPGNNVVAVHLPDDSLKSSATNSNSRAIKQIYPGETAVGDNLYDETLFTPFILFTDKWLLR